MKYMSKNVLNINKMLHNEAKKAGVRIGKGVSDVFYDHFSIFIEKYFPDLVNITKNNKKKTIDEEDTVQFFGLKHEI